MLPAHSTCTKPPGSMYFGSARSRFRGGRVAAWVVSVSCMIAMSQAGKPVASVQIQQVQCSSPDPVQEDSMGYFVGVACVVESLVAMAGWLIERESWESLLWRLSTLKRLHKNSATFPRCSHVHVLCDCNYRPPASLSLPRHTRICQWSRLRRVVMRGASW